MWWNNKNWTYASSWIGGQCSPKKCFEEQQALVLNEKEKRI